LEDPLESWTTDAEGIMDFHGEYGFRGFKGPYKIAIEKNGNIVTILGLNVGAEIIKIITINKSDPIFGSHLI